MEDALRGKTMTPQGLNKLVLILVLMEDALRAAGAVLITSSV